MPKLSETTSSTASGPAAANEPREGGWRTLGVGMVLLYALHLALLSYFMPWDRITGEVAISGFGDFPSHVNQAALFSEGMTEWGHGWVYDSSLIAGYPAGTIFDIDNKGWNLWIHMGRQLGWNIIEGNNWYVLSAHLLVPLVVAFAARCFGLGVAPTLVAVGIGMGLWWFDSFVHWCWWAGMLAFTFAGYMFLLPLACFYRYMQARSWGWALASAITLSIVHLIHPFAFFACVVPMLVMFKLRWAELKPAERASVFGIAGVVLLTNGWWLANAFAHWHYLVDSSHYGQSRLSFFFADFASLLLQPETTGMLGTRAGFRFLAWTFGLMGMWRWHKSGDERAKILFGGFCFGFVLTYFGGYVKLSAQIQPYRFVMPIAYMAALPAACFLVEAIRELRAQAEKSLAVWLAAGLSVLATMHLIRDVNYYFSESLPEPLRTFDGVESFYNAEGYPPPVPYRYSHYQPPQVLIDFVRKHDDGQSRWLVDPSFLGEELAWQTDAQIMGGFTLRNLTHSWANYFRRYPQGISRPAELRAYAETYAIGWVMMARSNQFLHRVPNPELELVETINSVKIFRTNIKPRLVVGGDPDKPPKVKARTNRIEISGSDPQADLLVKFHWHEKLICRPDCRIEKAPADDQDPIGFMRVPAPHPADFEIVNGY